MGQIKNTKLHIVTDIKVQISKRASGDSLRDAARKKEQKDYSDLERKLTESIEKKLMKKFTNQFNGMVRTKRNLGTNGGDCKDNNPNCASWAKTGLCKMNEKWMDKICKKSCGKCPNDENRNAAAITELRKKVED